MDYTDDIAAWTGPDLTTETPTVVVEPARPLLLTPEEAGALVRRSGGWMRRKAAAGEIPCTVLGRTVLFSYTDLDDLIVMHHRPATGA